MAKTGKDQVLMLISSDWFEKYLRMQFAFSQPEVIMKTKSAARTAVRHMMAGTDVYWNISFANERVKETEKCFFESLKREAVPKIDIDEIHEFINECVDADDTESTTVSLFWSVTRDIINKPHSNEEFPFDDKYIISMIESASEVERLSEYIEVHEAATETSTEWDTYLESLTPDLPLYIMDFALENCVGKWKFRAFWNNSTAGLSLPEKQALLNWYIERAKRKGSPGFQVSVPMWMSAEFRGKYT